MDILQNDLIRKAIFLAATCVIALVLQTIASKTIRRIFETGNVPRGSIFINLARALIWFLALLAVLEPVFGIQPTAFVAALGVMSSTSENVTLLVQRKCHPMTRSTLLP